MPYIRRQFIHNGEVTAPKLEANAFDGTIVANTAPVPPSGTAAFAIPMVVILNTPDASGDTTYVLPFKCRVVGVAVQKINAATGAFTHTVALKNGANAVTNASSFTSNARGHTNYASTIDDTYSTFAAGSSATLTVVKGAGGNAEFAVVVTLVRVA